MKNHELYHTDIYLGQDFSDGIKHWKYVKRVKVNGKWRYYYDDAEYSNAKNAVKTASKQYLEDYAKDYHAKEKIAEAKPALETARQNYLKDKNNEAAKKEYRKQSMNMANLEIDRDITDYYSAESKEAVKTAVNKYKKVKLKTAPRRIIAKGLAAIGNALSTLSSKVASYKKKK